MAASRQSTYNTFTRKTVPKARHERSMIIVVAGRRPADARASARPCEFFDANQHAHRLRGS
eukprot:1762059-Pyramimonas_sp.AAC.1